MPISARVITGVFDTPVFEGWPRSSSRASERGQFAATVRAARGDPEISSNILEHFLKNRKARGRDFRRAALRTGLRQCRAVWLRALKSLWQPRRFQDCVGRVNHFRISGNCELPGGNRAVPDFMRALAPLAKELASPLTG
jgi:hypothetical protein